MSLVYVTLPTGEQVVAEARGDGDLRHGETVSLGAPSGVMHIFGPDGLAVTAHDRALEAAQ
jgi:hypothetical protein